MDIAVATYIIELNILLEGSMSPQISYLGPSFTL